ncbi:MULTISPECIES: flagellar protein export ATPase FliI [Reinekea]|jgi:flagellum-specific ATP synthase|uniref:Flagellum-specific ATP synthase n=1 Tax=Reinekea forsetii TaxID=1336806 RepID=A0A2K8KPG7_9GAMM|nr:MULTISPECIES: flagellar protein export ATPase FliI [Reinekea]ATX76665.1 flagellum-specific ATP synthase FliI [Reinekea forsetii]MDO7644531.1 flagellar protein export ATPase FliI [Reinekea forsetii]
MSEQPLSDFIADCEQRVDTEIHPICQGRLTRMVGLTLEAVGLNASVGQRCQVIDQQQVIEAEVVGFHDEKTFLMPIQAVHSLRPGARVVPLETGNDLVLGDELLGRVVNGFGEAIDGKGELRCRVQQSLNGSIINPLHRAPIRQPLDVGIRAINSLLTVGRGQRLGLFAGSGVGKSVLLGMMTKFTDADITIVGLIGERGREVKEFIEDILGEDGLARSVVVASPADDAPLLRLRAAQYTTAIAEYFRSQGKSVLLLMDSLTRYAQAQREIALAIGEPPVTKGYPPSVFARIPQLVERAGNAEVGGGSITAFYTVLTEGDDQQDPVADASRAILDGHFVLNRKLAEEGHYPAIDIEQSISRAMPQVVSDEHLKTAQSAKQLWSTYAQNKDLIAIGAYTKGTNPEIDKAISLYPTLRDFLRQGLREQVPFKQSVQLLTGVVNSAPAAAAAGAGMAGGRPLRQNRPAAPAKPQ